MSQLVQISDLKRPENNKTYPLYGIAGNLTPVDIANLKRPKEVLELVDALTAMFKRIGMAEVCRACWAGEHRNRRERKDMGCCGTCPLVGHKACLAKPLGCALYMCYDATASKFPNTDNFLRAIRAELYKFAAFGTPNYNDKGLRVNCYPGAVYDESRVRLTRDEKKTLRILRWAVETWSEA